MKKIRDLTQAQFDAKVKRHGFKPQGFLGYYALPAPYDYRHVSIYNAGTNRRAQLAYLLAHFKQCEQEARDKR
jgi:hypothetical protein